jgi:hypothetical protein
VYGLHLARQVPEVIVSPMAQYALTGNIVASVIGAVVLCAAIVRYGFVSPLDEPDGMIRRLLFTRLAHTLAAVCFAVAAGLGVLVYALSSHVPATPAVTNAASAARDDIAALDSRVGAIETTMRQIDGNLGKILDRLHDLDHR